MYIFNQKMYIFNQKMYIFNQTHSHKAECVTISIYTLNKAGLNSLFSSFLTGCYTKAKQLNLPYYLHIAREELSESYFYYCSMKCKQLFSGFGYFRDEKKWMSNGDRKG